MKKLKTLFVIIAVILIAGFYNAAYSQNAPMSCVNIHDNLTERGTLEFRFIDDGHEDCFYDSMNIYSYLLLSDGINPDTTVNVAFVYVNDRTTPFWTSKSIISKVLSSLDSGLSTPREAFLLYIKPNAIDCY